MEIKRAVILSLIVILALSSFILLENKYNPMGVELSIRGNITEQDINKIKEISQIDNVTVNYSLPYGDNKLIMTTGMDRQQKNIDIAYGQFISSLDKKVAVIGDRVADAYFMTEEAIGKAIGIQGEEYEVIGILKKSKEIYIPFNQELKSLDWKTKSIKYTVKDREPLYAAIEKVEGKLRNQREIGVYDTIIYKEKIYGYKNLVIIVIIYVLALFIYKIYKYLKKEILQLIHEYIKERNSTEWYRFIKTKIKEIAKILTKLTGVLVLLLGILKIKSYFFLADTIIPDNLFSPSSYLNVLKFKYNQFILHLQNGFTDILIDTIIINISALLIIITITMIIGRKIAKKKKHLTQLAQDQDVELINQ